MKRLKKHASVDPYVLSDAIVKEYRNTSGLSVYEEDFEMDNDNEITIDLDNESVMVCVLNGNNVSCDVLKGGQKIDALTFTLNNVPSL